MNNIFRSLIVTVCAALLLSGCAGMHAQDKWPETVVTVEDMKIAKPMRLVVGYKISKGIPLGTTVLRLHVNRDGRVQNAGVMQTSGYANLDEAAIKSAWSAVFYPYQKDGIPTEVTLVMPIHLR